MEKKEKLTQTNVPNIWQWLVCPQTHGRLIYDQHTCELISLTAKLAYPVRSGIPVLLIEEARELDDVNFQHYAS